MLTILQYLKYLPVILEIVSQMERLVDLPGPEKKAMVIKMVADAITGLAPGLIKPDELDAISKLIDIVVSAANTFGVLGKKKK